MEFKLNDLMSIPVYTTKENGSIGICVRFSASINKWRFGYGPNPKVKFCGLGDTPEEAFKDWLKKSQQNG